MNKIAQVAEESMNDAIQEAIQEARMDSDKNYLKKKMEDEKKKNAEKTIHDYVNGCDFLKEIRFPTSFEEAIQTLHPIMYKAIITELHQSLENYNSVQSEMIMSLIHYKRTTDQFLWSFVDTAKIHLKNL